MTTISPRAQQLFDASRKTAPRLVNAANSSLHLYGIVGQDFTAASVIEALTELERAKGPVTVFVNSPGGDYMEGKAIHSALARFSKSHSTTAVVDGVAASAASFLIMAAGRVEMSPGSTLMVHEVHGGGFGRAQDLEAQAALIRSENAQLAGLYAKRIGQPVEDVLALLAQGDTYFTAEEAVENHFADGIAGEPAPKKSAPKKPSPNAALSKRATNLRINALHASVKRAPASRK